MSVQAEITRLLVSTGLLGLWLAAGPVVRAQQGALGKASHFTTVEYYEPPNDQQVRLRLSGTEALPQSGGLLLIKQLKLETFATNGRPQIVVTAPECVYDTISGTARSPGPLQVRGGDGKLQVQGRGFLWRQNDYFLTISNDVRTVIKQAIK